MLVIGASGVSAELCKNMVLAGIHSLTLLDDRAVTLADLSAQFLLTTSDIGKNVSMYDEGVRTAYAASRPMPPPIPSIPLALALLSCSLSRSCLCSSSQPLLTHLSPSPLLLLSHPTGCRLNAHTEQLAVSSIPQLQKLNPNVEVVADTAPLATKSDAFFKQFTIVCSTSEVLSSLVRINQLCRDSGIKFFAAQVFGYYGMLFADLQKHDFVYDQVSINKDTKEKTSKTKAATYQYCSLEAALQFKWPTPVLKPKRLARKIPTVGIGFFVLDRFQAVHGRR